jgi:hypothetical protein
VPFPFAGVLVIALHATGMLAKNVEAQHELAKVYGSLGKREQAIAAWRRDEALAATDAAAKKLLPEILAALKSLGAQSGNARKALIQGVYFKPVTERLRHACPNQDG